MDDSSSTKLVANDTSVIKIKQTEQGLQKALEKPDTFNPEPNQNFERVGRSIEVLYTGAKILGHEMMLDWKLSENMTRPNSVSYTHLTLPTKA